MMKRFLIVTIGLLVVISAPVSTASADLDSLIDLADRYPADAVGFWVERVDDATIDSLDMIYRGLARRVRGGFNEDQLSVRVQLDDWADRLQPGETFDTLFRSWLGDTMATAYFVDAQTNPMSSGFFSLNNLPRVWLIESTDADAAVTFWDLYLSSREETFEQTEQDGVVRFVVPAQEGRYDSDADRFYPRHDPYDVVVLDDVIVGGAPRMVDRVLAGDFGASLADDPTFDATMQLLPADDYAGVQYANMRAVFEVYAALNDVQVDLSSFEGELGGQARGLTMLDDRTLTVDYVQYTQNLDQLGFAIAPLGAIDPNFARHIPADAPLVFHGTNLSGVYETVRTNTEAYFRVTGENEGETGTEGIDRFAAELEAETGLNFERDILSLLTNDYAIFLDFNPELAEVARRFALVSDLPIEVGVAIDVTENPTAAAQLIPAVEAALDAQIAGLDEEAQQFVSVSHEREQVAGTEALVITITDLTGDAVPFPVEVILAVNEEILVLGTRATVEDMLAGAGGLSSDAEYTDAQQFALAEPEALAFIGFPNLLSLVDVGNALAGRETEQLLEDLLSLFSHWTASVAVDDEQNLLLRFTITIAPEEGS